MTHGLVNRAIQWFLNQTYGADLWAAVARDAGIGPKEFDAVLTYSNRVTEQMLQSAAQRLGQPRIMVLEDLGTFLVSDPSMESLRRLMRFGGTSFLEYLYSLEDLPERLRLIVPDFPVAELELIENGAGAFTLHMRNGWSGGVHVMQGVLRAMADDYGALALLELTEKTANGGVLNITLLDMKFSEGRAFSLRGPAA